MTTTDTPGRTPYRRRAWQIGLVVGLVVAVWWLVDYFPASTDTLVGRADDKAGVVDVVVEENQGDGLPFPFERASKAVTVTMEADSDADEIEDVLHAYDGDIDDEDATVDLVLQGGRGRLSLGVDIQVDDAFVDELVEAVADPQVLSYLREAYPVGPSVTVDLAPTDLAAAVAAADRFGDVEPVEMVTVESGGFLVIRDEQWGARSLARVHHREEVAIGLDQTFGLDGADIVDRMPLVVRVGDPANRAAVERYLAQLPPSAGIGRYRVVSR